ncbi:MAG: hypothetical protein AAF828_09840, partial [Bacteroidota bacterium]
MRKNVVLAVLTLLVLLPAGVKAQSAINTSIIVTEASPYLEDYADPGNVVLLVSNTDAQPYRFLLEVEIIVGGNFYRLRRPLPILLGSNETRPLDFIELRELFTPNALDLASRDLYYALNGRFPEGFAQFNVRAYDANFPNGEVVSNIATAIANIQLNQPPQLRPFNGLDYRDDFVPAYTPQTALFQWYHFPPANGLYAYTIQVWDVADDPGFGEQFIVDNVRPLIVAPATLTSPGMMNFLLTDASPLLTPGHEYLWRVGVEDLSMQVNFDNNGFSEIGRFLYGGNSAEECYVPTNLSVTGGDGITPFSLSWDAAAIAPQNLHRLTIFNAQTEEVVSINSYGQGTYSFSGEEGDFRLTQVQADIDTAGFPLRAELCVLCPDGSSSCESIVYGTIIEDSPCPPATLPDWILIDENTVTVTWQPGNPNQPHTATIVDVADDLPTQSGGSSIADGLGNDGELGEGGFIDNSIGNNNNEKTFNNLESGHDYRVTICAPCDVAPFTTCTELYFTMPDIADCNLQLLADVEDITPNSATVNWTANSEWADRFSLHLNGDSLAIGGELTTFTFTGLEGGEDYDLEICAYCPGLYSDRMCQVLSFTTPNPRCVELADLNDDLVIAATADNGILVDWSGLAAEVVSSGGLLQLLDAGTREVLITANLAPEATSYTFENLTVGETYAVNFCLSCPLDADAPELCLEMDVPVVSCDGLDIVGLNAADIGASYAELYWNNPDGLTTDEYFIRYREDDDLLPFSEPLLSSLPQYRLENLAPLTAYDVMVCYTCETEADQCVEMTFTTEGITCATAGDHPLEYSCGQDGEIIVDNTLPDVSSLVMGDSVWAGDFLVRIDEVSASSPYAGTGRMIVPYLNEAVVRVEFDAIKVNQGCRMYEGSMKVISPYRELLETVNDFVGDFNNSLNDIQAGLDQLINLLTTVNDWANDWIQIYNAIDIVMGAAEQNPWVDPAAVQQVQDALDCYENATTQEQRDSCQTQLVEALEDFQESMEELYDADFQVPFVANPGQAYGWDVQTYPEMNELGWYSEVPDINERPYKVAWKSLKRGETDIINAVRDPEGNLAGIQFRTQDSTEISYAAVQGSEEVSLDVNAAEGETIFAIQMQQNDSGVDSAKIAGQLALVEYDELPIEIVFVPVNGVSMAGIDQPALAAELSSIFQQAVVKPTVVLAAPLAVPDVPETIPNRASGVRSYQREFREIIRANEARATYTDGKYFIYLVQDYEADEDGFSRSGYMPRKRSDGFIFVDNVLNATNLPPNLTTAQKIARTTAHEIGHGAYHLQHVWQEAQVGEEGAPDNMMSYFGGGRLHKWQCDLMHDPVPVSGLFEGDDDGESVVVPNMASFEPFLNESTNTLTLISPSGMPFTLLPGADKIEFNNGDEVYEALVENSACNQGSYLYPFGSVRSFYIGADKYEARFDCIENKFLGYFNDETQYQDFFTVQALTDNSIEFAVIGYPCLNGGEITFYLGKVSVIELLPPVEVQENRYTSEGEKQNYLFLQEVDIYDERETDGNFYPSFYSQTVVDFIKSLSSRSSCGSDYFMYIFAHAFQLDRYPRFGQYCPAGDVLT